MRPPIDGGTILITGASSGIGEALARELAPRAAVLILVARRTERLEQLASALREAHGPLEIDVLPCDLTDRAAIASMLADLAERGRAVDVLVNNAGLGDFAMFDLSSWEKQERMIDLNVTALTYLTHRLVAPMVERGRGGILQVSSGFGLQFMPGFAGYVATKHFVTGLTESLRVELSPLGIVVSQLCPGPVATEFEQHASDFEAPAIPSVVQISAEQCAREAVRGFDRGKPIIVPGLVMRFANFLGVWSPRWMRRFLFGLIGRQMRAMQLEATSRS